MLQLLSQYGPIESNYKDQPENKYKYYTVFLVEDIEKYMRCTLVQKSL